MSQGYASLYVTNGTTTQAVTTTEAVIAALAAAGPSSGSSSGGNQDVIADAANKQLKLRAGVYQVSFSLALKNLYSVAILTARAFKNSAGIPGMFTRMVGTALTGASFASGNSLLTLSGMVEITEDDLTAGYATLDVRVSTPAGTLTITPTYGQLAAVRVGG